MMPERLERTKVRLRAEILGYVTRTDYEDGGTQAFLMLASVFEDALREMLVQIRGREALGHLEMPHSFDEHVREAANLLYQAHQDRFDGDTTKERR